MTAVYKPNKNRYRASESAPVDMKCCRAVVTRYIGNWPSHGQCLRKGTVEEDGMLWCKIHAPSEVKKRDQAKREKFDADLKRRMTQNAGPRLLSALREIAKGEMNDPAGYASMILEDLKL